MSDYEFPPPNTGFVSGVVPGPDQERCWYFVFSGPDLLLRFDSDGQFTPLTEADTAFIDSLDAQSHYLGMQDDIACYAIDAVSLPADAEKGGLRSVFGRTDNDMLALAGRAQQVCDWWRTHRYCGRCGAEKRPHPNDRAMVCDDCGIHAYPRLSPSIIVLVHHGDEVLLARNHRFPAGMYSTLAGFVEPGESIEQTVRREVKEEVGVTVGHLEYLGSQPWPFPNSLMLGFHAEFESGSIVCQEDEIADAQWFPVDNLPEIPGAVAISRWLIDAYLASRGISP